MVFWIVWLGWKIRDILEGPK